MQNPNALDKKVLLDFDHVKNSLKVDEEGKLKASSTMHTRTHMYSLCNFEVFSFLLAELKKKNDPSYNINVSGDIKKMLEELGTEKAKQTALLGGGGSKAQNERAAALAAILAARSRVKEDSEKDSNGATKAPQAFSIVDAASASVHGRSAAAAKATSGDKTAARIAMHMAGERAPVNAKLVSSSQHLLIAPKLLSIRSYNTTSTLYLLF